MTSLQASLSSSEPPAGAVHRNPRRRSWKARLLSWWTGPAGRPLILRRIAACPPGASDVGAGRPSLAEIGAVIAVGALQRRADLMNAYVATAVDVALEAEALGDGTPARQVRTPIHDLVAEVVGAPRPCAKTVGATLAYDADSHWSCVAVTDPGRLRKALTHLVLRALSSGAEPGALVRILVAAEPAATRIGVLAVRGAPELGLFDLAALVRLIQAIGGALEIEPSRAGCTPIAIVLPAPAPETPALALGRRPVFAEGAR